MNDEMVMLPNVQRVYHSTQTHIRNKYDVYISGFLDSPETRIEQIHTIRNAQEGDLVYVYINSRGGYVSTGLAFINAIQQTPATVFTVLDGEAASMGALIFLSGDQMIIGSGFMMLHNIQSGISGHVDQMDNYISHLSDVSTAICDPVVKKFLTKSEFKDFKAGKDIFFTSEQVFERFQMNDKKNGKGKKK